MNTPVIEQEKVILAPVWDRNIVFHFNKAFLKDPTIPMWVVKVKGQTYYINHLDSKIGFSTKETPESTTQGSLKFRGTISIIEKDSQTIATIEE